MSFTYYVIKNEDAYGKLKNDGRMIDYVYGPDTSKIWWRNLWTAPYCTLEDLSSQPIYTERMSLLPIFCSPSKKGEK